MHFLNKPACKAEEFKDEKIKELLFVGKQSAQNYHTRISNIITENLSFNGDCSFDSKNSVTSFNPFEYFSGTSPARPCTERSHQSHSAENLIDKEERDCNGNEIHNTLSNASTFVPKSGERLMEFEIDMRKDGKEIEVEFDNLEEKHKENLELDIIDDSFCDHSIVSRYSISTTTDRNTMEKLPLGLFKKKEKKEEMQSFESLGTLGFVSMPSLEECANDVKEDQVNNLLEVEDKIITVEEKKNRIGHRSNGALTREERKKDIMGKEVNEGKKDTIEEGGKEDLISKDGNEDVIGREENECVTVKNDTIHACVDVKNESKLHTENDIEEVNLTDINTPSLVQRKPDGKFLGQLMQASIEIDVGISKLVKKKNNSLNSMALVNGEFETPIQLKKSQSLSLCNSNTNDGSNMTKTLRRSSSGTPNPEKNINTFNDSDGLKEKTENDVHCNVASELINDQSPHNHNGSVSTDNDSEGIAETLLSQNTVGSTIQSNEQKGGLCDDIEIVRMMTHQSSLQLSGYGPNVVIDKSAKSSIQGLNDNNVGYTKFMSQLSNQMSYKESRGEIVSFLSIEGDQEVLRIFSMNSSNEDGGNSGKQKKSAKKKLSKVGGNLADVKENKSASFEDPHAAKDQKFRTNKSGNSNPTGMKLLKILRFPRRIARNVFQRKNNSDVIENIATENISSVPKEVNISTIPKEVNVQTRPPKPPSPARCDNSTRIMSPKVLCKVPSSFSIKSSCVTPKMSSPKKYNPLKSGSPKLYLPNKMKQESLKLSPSTKDMSISNGCSNLAYVYDAADQNIQESGTFPPSEAGGESVQGSQVHIANLKANFRLRRPTSLASPIGPAKIDQSFFIGPKLKNPANFPSRGPPPLDIANSYSDQIDLDQKNDVTISKKSLDYKKVSKVLLSEMIMSDSATTCSEYSDQVWHPQTMKDKMNTRCTSQDQSETSTGSSLWSRSSSISSVHSTEFFE